MSRLSKGHTDAEWKALIVACAWRCFYCNNSVFENSQDRELCMTKDHLVPVINGGSDYIENIAVACKRCNSLKGKKSLEEFLADRRMFSRVVEKNAQLRTSFISSITSRSFYATTGKVTNVHTDKPIVLKAGEVCPIHPESGRTHWNTCWACYTLRCQGKKPSESSMEVTEELRKLR